MLTICYWPPVPFELDICHGILPSRCLLVAELDLEDAGTRVLIPPPEVSLACSLGNGLESNIANPLITLTLASGVELASEAVRLIFFGASPEVVLDDCCDSVDEVNGARTRDFGAREPRWF